MRALSERNDDPTHASRPFDRDRDGFVLSEVAGLLVLEELEHAKARGARIYGELYGYGVQLRRRPHYRPRQGRRRRRLRHVAGDQDAGIAPGNRLHQRPRHQHAAGRSRRDNGHEGGLQAPQGEHFDTKSQLGHLLGASGGVELVLCLLAIRDGLIPPTINLDTPDPECNLDYTPNQARQRAVSIAMSNSFGFGGHNGSLVVGKVRNG